MKKLAVVLSGCGHRDGSEITEAVSSLIAISMLGATYQVFAPNMKFAVSHPLTGEPTGEQRSTMEEVGRIARGKVKDLAELSEETFDAVVFPGGYGVVLNLSTWAKDGAQCTVHPEAERVIKGFYAANKPIAGICIAPALLARVLGSYGISVTIGNDRSVAAEIAKTGAHHENCRVDDFVTDREHRLITTPAYMYDEAKPSQVFLGIQRAINELIEMS